MIYRDDKILALETLRPTVWSKVIVDHLVPDF